MFYEQTARSDSLHLKLHLSVTAAINISFVTFLSPSFLKLQGKDCAAPVPLDCEHTLRSDVKSILAVTGRTEHNNSFLSSF